MGFEKLRVYQAAQQLDAEVQAIIREITESKVKGQAKNLDHLNRALGSLLFNVPEAYGCGSRGKEIDHLRIARGEVDEVRGVLRRLVSNGVVTERRIRRACELTSVIAKMLTAWINSIEGR